LPANLLNTAAFASVRVCATLRQMEPLREIGRSLLVLGGLIALVGAFFYFGGKLPFRLGRLPGDIVHEGEHSSFYFPLTTCILLSVGLSLLFWLLSRFRR
jgi:hypothetical protein